MSGRPSADMLLRPARIASEEIARHCINAEFMLPALLPTDGRGVITDPANLRRRLRAAIAALESAVRIIDQTDWPKAE